MNLDELRTVQSKERSKDSLQHLRESFYADVADYISDLKDQRERAAERADRPFDDPEVNRLTDEINTAEDVAEAVYERRVGKIVKRASLAAAGMPADEEGLTGEEQALFTELVERIETNKEQVLDVLAGEATPTADPSPTPAADTPPTADADTPPTADAAGDAGSPSDPAPEPGDPPASGDSAASASGASPDANATGGASDESDADVSAADVMGGGTDARDASAESDAETETGSDSEDLLAGLDERTTVRVTDDVGEIFGVDERTYELAREDVVTLPEANAAPLVERGAAEKLE